MKMQKITKTMWRTAAGAAFAMTMASQAAAVSVFTVDPSVLGGAAAPFDANFIGGVSSELLNLDSNTNTVTGGGWLQFTSFSLNSQPVLPGISRLGVDYGLYLTFDISLSLTSGTFGAAGSEYAITSLNYQVWGDPNLNTSFAAADASSGTAAAVTGGAADDLLIGIGALISGVAGFNEQFGAFLNSLVVYANTAFGDTFFVEPNPFYNLAFNEFNNTAQGVEVAGACTSPAGCLISINQATGGVDFLIQQTVPEPATLALLGIGLMGLGASTRRRKF